MLSAAGHEVLSHSYAINGTSISIGCSITALSIKAIEACAGSSVSTVIAFCCTLLGYRFLNIAGERIT